LPSSEAAKRSNFLSQIWTKWKKHLCWGGEEGGHICAAASGGQMRQPRWMAGIRIPMVPGIWMTHLGTWLVQRNVYINNTTWPFYWDKLVVFWLEGKCKLQRHAGSMLRSYAHLVTTGSGFTGHKCGTTT